MYVHLMFEKIVDRLLSIHFKPLLSQYGQLVGKKLKPSVYQQTKAEFPDQVAKPPPVV